MSSNDATALDAQVRPVYFWHIPKTAGSTVTAWLDRQTDAARVFRPQLLPDFLRAHENGELACYDLFRGHFADAPMELLQRRPISFTLLREPVARTLSHLAHVERDPNHPLHERIVGCHGDLDRALRDPVVRRMVENFQARYLVQHYRPANGPEHACYDVVPLSHPLFEQMRFEFSPLPPSHWIAASALRRLAAFDVVGTTARVDDTLARLAARLGWACAGTPEPTNVRPTDQKNFDGATLRPNQRLRIRQLTRVDRWLYDAVRLTMSVVRRRAG